MGQGPQEIAGRCLCGAVTFTARIAEMESAACHCSMCRRWSSGIIVVVDASDIAFADGAPVKAYASSDWAERLFCGECGSHLAWRLRDGSYANVSLYALDPPIDAPLRTEVYIDEKPADYALAGTTTKMTGAEVMALFSAEGE